MSKNVIFYFTGTGNSLKAAKDIAKKIGDCDMFLMPSYKEKKILSGYERVGFVFPTYVGGLPFSVRKFMIETDFSPSKDAYFFTVVTYGGAQGNSFFMVNSMLEKQRIILNACFGIAMRPNYIVKYDMPKFVYKLSAKSPQKINAAAEKIMRKVNTSVPKRKSNVQEKIYHKFIKECHDMDRDFNVSENCISCGLCSKVCPVKNIKIIHDKPKFLHQCEQCMACIHACPQQAINYKNKTQKRSRYINPDISVQELGTQINIPEHY